MMNSRWFWASTVVNTQVQKHFMFKQILRQHLTNIVVKEGNVAYWRVTIWSIFSSCNIVQLSIDWESKPRDNIINKLKRENIFKYCPSLPASGHFLLCITLWHVLLIYMPGVWLDLSRRFHIIPSHPWVIFILSKKFRLIGKGWRALQAAAVTFQRIVQSPAQLQMDLHFWLDDATAQYSVQCTLKIEMQTSEQICLKSEILLWKYPVSPPAAEIEPNFREIFGNPLQNPFYATALAFISAVGDKRRESLERLGEVHLRWRLLSASTGALCSCTTSDIFIGPRWHKGPSNWVYNWVI